MECGDQGVDIPRRAQQQNLRHQCKKLCRASGQRRRAGGLRGRGILRLRRSGGRLPDDIHSFPRELAESTGVELWDGEQLSHMMRVSGRRPHHDQAGRRAIIQA